MPPKPDYFLDSSLKQESIAWRRKLQISQALEEQKELESAQRRAGHARARDRRRREDRAARRSAGGPPSPHTASERKEVEDLHRLNRVLTEDESFVVEYANGARPVSQEAKSAAADHLHYIGQVRSDLREAHKRAQEAVLHQPSPPIAAAPSSPAPRAPASRAPPAPRAKAARAVSGSRAPAAKKKQAAKRGKKGGGKKPSESSDTDDGSGGGSDGSDDDSSYSDAGTESSGGSSVSPPAPKRRSAKGAASSRHAPAGGKRVGRPARSSSSDSDTITEVDSGSAAPAAGSKRKAPASSSKAGTKRGAPKARISAPVPLDPANVQPELTRTQRKELERVQQLITGAPNYQTARQLIPEALARSFEKSDPAQKKLARVRADFQSKFVDKSSNWAGSARKRFYNALLVSWVKNNCTCNGVEWDPDWIGHEGERSVSARSPWIPNSEESEEY